MKFVSWGLCLCLIAVSIGTCYGQKFSLGLCPLLTSSTATALKFSTLAGTWNEYARYHSLYQHDWQCVTYTITKVTENVRYTVAISGSKKHFGVAKAAGVMDIAGDTQSAMVAAGTYLKLAISYRGYTSTLNYYVIATDGTNYLALYGCQNLPFGKIDNVLLLAQPGTTQSHLATAFTAIYGFGVPRNALLFTYTLKCVAK